MVSLSTRGSEHEDYAAVFADYIATGVATSLSRVRATPGTLAEADRQQAWHLLSYALQRPAAWPVTCELLLALAPKMQLAGFGHDWIAYLEQGLDISGRVGDRRGEAALSLEIGEVRRHLGQYAEAEARLREGVALSQQVGDQHGEAGGLVCLAHLACLTQRPGDALALADAALALVTPDDPLGGRAFFVKGLVYDGGRQFEEAETCFRQAQAIWALANDRRWVALCQQNLAGLAQERQQYDEAIETYRQAATLLREVGDRRSLATVMMNQGIAHYLNDETVEALALYQQAEIIYQQYFDLRGQAMVCNNIALIYRAQHDYQNAELYYLQSVQIWRYLGDVKRRVNVEDGLGRLYIDSGRRAEAAAHYQRLLVELEQTEHDREYLRLREELAEHLAMAAAVPAGGGR